MQAEVALCQRYFARMGSLSGIHVAFGSGFSSTTGLASIYTKFPVAMRIRPVITASATAVNDTFAKSATINSYQSGTESAWVELSASGLTLGRAVLWTGFGNPNAYVDLNSEL
jgi:hypothetical protein